MSGATTLSRNAAQGATPSGRTGWLSSLKSDALSFVKGDNNAPWAILAESIIGCVPVLGQLVDARDILKGLISVSSAPVSPAAWFELITALIGLVPGAGDAVKRSLRAVKSRSVPVDTLLDMIRRLNIGDPEKLLKDTLDVSRLRKSLDGILGNQQLLSGLSPAARKNVDAIRGNLNKQFDEFKREIDGWLTKGRKTSADTPPASKATPGTPASKPNTQAKQGTKGSGQHSNATQTNAPNAATQRTARFKTLTNKVLGVLGEHMADYHCQDVKGWGKKTAHDKGGVNSAKLNDAGQLVQLWPVRARGRGLDAVWKTTGASKPYAIIEAKASYDPTKSLRSLLGEAWDKTERESGGGPSSRRGGGAGRRGGGSGAKADEVRQLNGKTTQMGHAWIQRRLPRALSLFPKDLEILRKKKESGYQRHVLFFSIPHAVSHAEALIKLTAKQSVLDSFHAEHTVTREWRDSDIDRVVDNRAGLHDKARKR